MAVRILGGTHRSRLIATPKGQNTRPTRSMVREAVFNILQGEVAGQRVLDLFAGSGAMGLEALSRGAAQAVFCDRDIRAVKAVLENLKQFDFTGAAQVKHAGWEQAIRELSAQRQRFHLIFLDPPYKMEAEPLLTGIANAGLLAASGRIILEQSTQAEPNIPPSIALKDQRRYGQTHLYILANKGEPE